jgi:quinol monooxygenase YgiN
VSRAFWFWDREARGGFAFCPDHLKSSEPGPLPGVARGATNPLRAAMHPTDGGSTMDKLAIWAQVEAKPGKEQEVADFLKSAQALAEKEEQTLSWYAVKIGPARFGIFDTFADEKGRDAHLTGEIAKALFSRAQELFLKEPEVHKIEILAVKSAGPSASARGAGH